MARVFNFSAGPSMLPESVLQKAAAEMLDYNGTGQSVMEMSHRSTEYQAIIDTAETGIRELMLIPANYKVLFLQGGASSQFAMVPLNLFGSSAKADFINTGTYDRRREFFKTESPSMDILISSNLERLLFELVGRNPGEVSNWMNQLSTPGWYRIPKDALDQLQTLFYGGFADHKETSIAIGKAFKDHGYLMDPHSAVGYSVLKKYWEETGDTRPALLASTASPFKFNRAVLEAIGRDTSNKDEFGLLQELSSITGQPVPARLAELKI